LLGAAPPSFEVFLASVFFVNHRVVRPTGAVCPFLFPKSFVDVVCEMKGRADELFEIFLPPVQRLRTPLHARQLPMVGF